MGNVSRPSPLAPCAQANIAQPSDATSLRALLGPKNVELCSSAVDAIAAGDVGAIGAIMSAAQRAFDRAAAPVCPDQLTAPLLHAVLAHEALTPHVAGSKGVGSQGDGAAQLLCWDAAAMEAATAIVKHDLHLRCTPMLIGRSMQDASARARARERAGNS